jgi:hypothetical protein
VPDPLPLPRPVALESRRRRGGPQERPAIDRPSHGRDIADGLDTVDELAGGPAEDPEDDVPIVLKLAGSTRLDTGPFRALGLEALGESADWTYYALAGAAGRLALRELVGRYATPDVDWDRPASWAGLLDNLTGVSLYSRSDRADPDLNLLADEAQIVDVTLWPASSPAVAARRLGQVEATVAEATASDPTVRILAADPRPDTLSVRVNADAGLLDDLLSLAVVERVRPPLRPLITLGDIVASGVPPELPDPDGETLGIVDDLAVTANPLLATVITGQDGFPTGHVFSPPSDHGTHVSSVAAYGSLDGFATGDPVRAPFPVAVARVLDVDAFGQTQMTGQPHVTFEHAVRWLVAEHGTRIVNCSINYPHPVAGGLPDLLTVAVDAVSRELGVVIVVSAGNRVALNPGGHWLTGYPDYLHDPEARLAAPADAALAVTVGGAAHRDVPAGAGAGTGTAHTAIAPATRPSPFTRSGPARSAGGTGKWGTSKPEFAHAAGNWAWDHAGNRLVDKDWGLGVVVATPPTGGRFLGVTTGTSVAAPAVAHELARIATRYPDAGPNLLRAYLALSARQSDGHIRPAMADQALFSAYGQPDAGRVLDSGGNRVLLKFEGTIDTGAAVIHRLPIPSAFVGSGRHRTVRVALAFDPPVRRARREYVAGHMSVELVYGLTLAEVRAQYRQQPTRAEAEADPTLTRLGPLDADYRPQMYPRSTRLLNNTLLRRDFDGGTWQERHLECFLVVTHDHTKSSPAQQRAYPSQDYALVVELADETDIDLDLHAAVRQRLRARIRT